MIYKLPDFICIGAPKAGTTWIHACLAAHPDIQYCHMKEVGFWNYNFLEGLKFYSDILSINNDMKITGDISPAYCLTLSDYRKSILKWILPDCKIIFLLRNPIERTWSDVCMRVSGAKDETNIYRTQYIKYRDFNEVPEEEIIKEFSEYSADKFSRYSEMIPSWKNIWGDQLEIWLYDDIKTNPKNLLSEIYKFIGIENPNWNIIPWNKKINVSANQKPMSNKYRMILTEQFHNEINQLTKMFTGREKEIIKGWIE